MTTGQLGLRNQLRRARYFLQLSPRHYARALDHPLSRGRLRLISAYHGYRRRELFHQVQHYCMFVGYPRSGHSLIGALLDAHPDMVFSHELDALKFLQAGFSRQQIWACILDNASAAAAAGRKNRRTKYDYTVPNQWQGRYRRLQVIGDKKGGKSSSSLYANPELLDCLRDTMGVPVKIIHVTRNPYDNIATMFRRSVEPLPLAEIAHRYFVRGHAAASVQKRTEPQDWLTVRYETFLENPETCLTQICGFLGVTAPADYLRDCTAIIYRSPHKSRHNVDWDPALVTLIEQQIARYDFLHGYSGQFETAHSTFEITRSDQTS